jgi:hypothetical protein
VVLATRAVNWVNFSKTTLRRNPPFLTDGYRLFSAFFLHLDVVIDDGWITLDGVFRRLPFVFGLGVIWQLLEK